ncbi:RNA polymerase sigma factor [Niabella hirudinis]|uniref:RNA polymerase sigma factor n=1 Tax=Niabella hirudinis TaxID=1285929 RepID=UPI003EBC0B45
MNGFDASFFESVFYQNYDRLYSGFFKKTRSEAIAQELTQLSFIKFWEYRASFTADLPTELQLNRKAKLVYIDWLRKEAHQRRIAAELSKHSNAGQTSNSFELTHTLQIALDKLPPIRKKVFTLAYVEGFSYKEIAGDLGISVKTVDAHIQKALKQLRKMLAFYAVLSLITAG